ncbi:hypothetical protein HBA54_07480 [Pelagibius litoralis]|uniref:Uncharacterized protein n=1 Tax=Pelagibius litoralis TaxID=374515 RepID=A0A967C208_9PROT|nr:DUF6134 family protein [Pelagibius litoralis]NIA68431.1 hypothetical protein [Pelagibius litoralis]
MSINAQRFTRPRHPSSGARTNHDSGAGTGPSLRNRYPGNRFAAAVAGFVVLAAAVLTSAPAAAQDNMIFDVLRDGEKIGEHRVTFEHEEDCLKVSVETGMAVRIAFLTVFRYDHKRVERWRDGALDSLAGMTNDDGEEYEVSIVHREGTYSRTVNGIDEEIAGPVSIDSLWSKDRLTAGKLFSSADDKVYRVRSDLMGQKIIELDGKPVEAAHYRMSGQLTRDLWFAPDGMLAQLRYEDDGYVFEYVRR